jgi:Protein of unknown function, DUF547
MSHLSSLLHCAFLIAVLGVSLGPGRGEATTFSHEDWATVLKNVVDERGLVSYQALARDRAALDRYLEQIRTTSPANRPELFPTRDDELAYYLNAYNALVFGQVLAREPGLETVWGMTGTGLSFFGLQKVTVGGKRMSLKTLEDEVIREGFQDPRIHAALNCASISCPRLPREPFLGESLGEQLDAAMKEFVADERNVRQEAGRVFLSKIFDWFGGDFLAFERKKGVEAPSLLGYINRFRPADAQLRSDLAITFLDYDKRLNRQP